MHLTFLNFIVLQQDEFVINFIVRKLSEPIIGAFFYPFSGLDWALHIILLCADGNGCRFQPDIWWDDAQYHQADCCLKWLCSTYFCASTGLRNFAMTGFLSNMDFENKLELRLSCTNPSICCTCRCYRTTVLGSHIADMEVSDVSCQVSLTFKDFINKMA